MVGALTEELKVTNICLVEKVIHYDMDTSAADHCEVGRYLEYQDIYLPTTKKYVQLVKIITLLFVQLSALLVINLLLMRQRNVP